MAKRIIVPSMISVDTLLSVISALSTSEAPPTKRRKYKRRKARVAPTSRSSKWQKVSTRTRSKPIKVDA